MFVLLGKPRFTKETIFISLFAFPHAQLSLEAHSFFQVYISFRRMENNFKVRGIVIPFNMAKSLFCLSLQNRFSLLEIICSLWKFIISFWGNSFQRWFDVQEREQKFFFLSNMAEMILSVSNPHIK